MRLAVERVTTGSLFRGLRSRVSDLGPVYRAVVTAFRELVAEEFRGGYWMSPNGRRIPWRDRVPFGDDPGGPSRLEKSGALRRAWLGGPGSIEDYDSRSVTIGVDARRLPYAPVHRGGSGELRAGTIQDTRIRVTPKMRVYLGRERGVWLRQSTTHLEIPARPHATVSPELRTRITALAAAHVTGRRLPGAA